MAGESPDVWKEEEGSVLPKGNNSDGFNQLKNVSSMSIFLKLCETYLLEQLREEVELPPNQFDGTQGARTKTPTGGPYIRPVRMLG